MRLVVIAVSCAALMSVPFVAVGQKTAPKRKTPAKKSVKPLPFKEMKDNISYAIGADFGKRVYGAIMRPLGASMVTVDRKKLAAAIALSTGLAKNLRQRGLQIDDKRLKEGFQDAMTGAKAKLDDSQTEAVFEAAQKQIVAARKNLGAKNKKEGQAFLEANKKKEGVKTTKSGLQYIVIKAGAGKSPKATDVVVTHYVGTLLDGTEFDSSKNAAFEVNGVIRGWQEALQLMKKGAKWKLFVPAELAYRERGKGSSIGPNAVLIFEIELIDIKGAPKFSPRER